MNNVSSTQSAAAVLVNRWSSFSAFFVGAGTGFFGWLLTLFFRDYIVVNIFCRSADDFGVCANGGNVAWWAAFVIVGLVSVFALVRVGVYRPLLVVLASMLALWGIAPWLAPLAWYWAAFWTTVLFGLAYALFAWLATIERFVYSVLAMVVVIVLVRLTLMV